MRITIPTTGSRGDVQPYVALGVGLQRAGHRVRLATHADFEDFVRAHGLDFFPIEANGQAFQGQAIGEQMVRAGGNPFMFIRHFVRLRLPVLPQMMAATWEACADCDLVLVTMPSFFLGHSVAERLKVPACYLTLQPTLPSRHLGSCLFPPAPGWPVLDQVYNLLTHLVGGACFWKALRKGINTARREVLELPPVTYLGLVRSMQNLPLTLAGFSPLVVPPPTDWNDKIHATGYWLLNNSRDWRPPHDLEAFLQAGAPPVYIGFGSIQERRAEELTTLVETALARAGQRGVLLGGWGALRRRAADPRFFYLDAAPHDWLFPRMAAVVHHGGAGTTAAGLKAGIPSIVVPHHSDQPFWGRRVAALGAGPAPIARSELTAARLEEAIRQATTDRRMQARAAALGVALRAEDGVGRAVEAIERYAHTLDIPTRSRRHRAFPVRSFVLALAQEKSLTEGTRWAAVNKRTNRADRAPQGVQHPGDNNRHQQVAGRPPPIVSSEWSRKIRRTLPPPDPILMAMGLVLDPSGSITRPSDWTVPLPWRRGHAWGPAANTARQRGDLAIRCYAHQRACAAAFALEHLQEGDVLFRRGRSLSVTGPFITRLLSDICDSPFSHNGIAHWEDGRCWVYDVELQGLRKIPFDVWMLDVVEGSLAVCRLRPPYRDRIPQILAYCQDAYKRVVPYDHGLSRDEDRLYCTEMVEKAFRSAGLPLSEPVPICCLPNYPRWRWLTPFVHRFTPIRVSVPIYSNGNDRWGQYSSPYLERVYESPAIRSRPHVRAPIGTYSTTGAP